MGEKRALKLSQHYISHDHPKLSSSTLDEATEQAKLCVANKHLVYLHLFSSIHYWPRLDRVSHFPPQSPGAKLVGRRRPLSGQLARESPAGSWHAVAHRCHIHGSSALCGPVCLWWCKQSQCFRCNIAFLFKQPNNLWSKPTLMHYSQRISSLPKLINYKISMCKLCEGAGVELHTNYFLEQFPCMIVDTSNQHLVNATKWRNFFYLRLGRKWTSPKVFKLKEYAGGCLQYVDFTLWGVQKFHWELFWESSNEKRPHRIQTGDLIGQQGFLCLISVHQEHKTCIKSLAIGNSEYNNL